MPWTCPVCKSEAGFFGCSNEQCEKELNELEVLSKELEHIARKLEYNFSSLELATEIRALGYRKSNLVLREVGL